jgi:alkylation response protein AidB-like acyl-CoA dehydrogenase
MSMASARFTTKVVLKVTQDALTIFGGMGVMKELPLEKYVRDTMIFTHLADGPARQVKAGNLLMRSE